MNIGFDAKRAYHNKTGLGHYSRTLIHSLATYFPDNEYYLFNPKRSTLFGFEEDNVHEFLPNGFPSALFTSAWRSSWVKKDLKKLRIDLYHGLSHEIPIGMRETRIKTVVTIHDLIHERFPGQYNPIDVKIYRKKFRYACEQAHRVIAISEQTKKDITAYYEIPASKIEVCYQSCHPAFGEQVSAEEKKTIKQKYNLPENFFLHVGSVIERKNLLNICKAVYILRNEIQIPLVVIGDGGKYKEMVKDFIKQNHLEDRVIFLSETPSAKSAPFFQSAVDFPAIYQSAIAMIYPSFFEGFGIPVLEALWSKLPVITSNVSSLPEAGGPGAYYVNPQSAEEIAQAMKKIYKDGVFATGLKEKGWGYAQNFTQQKCAASVMKVYESLISSKV
jgi:glycosyltransferase involved in cell wall biosynthesis